MYQFTESEGKKNIEWKTCWNSICMNFVESDKWCEPSSVDYYWCINMIKMICWCFDWLPNSKKFIQPASHSRQTMMVSGLGTAIVTRKTENDMLSIWFIKQILQYMIFCCCFTMTFYDVTFAYLQITHWLRTYNIHLGILERCLYIIIQCISINKLIVQYLLRFFSGVFCWGCKFYRIFCLPL